MVLARRQRGLLHLADAFSVFAGKMDTLDGDMNAFAHGRGKTQFSNMGFVFNPIVGATVPYSTLGAGFVYHPEDGPMAMVTVLNSTDTTATSGFDSLFNDGLLLSAAVRVPTNLFDRPGHQLLGGTWNSRTYTSITEAYIPYPDVAIPTTRGSWCLYWNFDQFLVVDPADDTRGWGPFGRAGIADPNTSPIDAFLSFGVGQGIECFYNYALTPAVRITPDGQVGVRVERRGQDPDAGEPAPADRRQAGGARGSHACLLSPTMILGMLPTLCDPIMRVECVGQ